MAAPHLAIISRVVSCPCVCPVCPQYVLVSAYRRSQAIALTRGYRAVLGALLPQQSRQGWQRKPPEQAGADAAAAAAAHTSAPLRVGTVGKRLRQQVASGEVSRAAGFARWVGAGLGGARSRPP